MSHHEQTPGELVLRVIVAARRGSAEGCALLDPAARKPSTTTASTVEINYLGRWPDVRSREGRVDGVKVEDGEVAGRLVNTLSDDQYLAGRRQHLFNGLHARNEVQRRRPESNPGRIFRFDSLQWLGLPDAPWADWFIPAFRQLFVACPYRETNMLSGHSTVSDREDERKRVLERNHHAADIFVPVDHLGGRHRRRVAESDAPYQSAPAPFEQPGRGTERSPRPDHLSRSSDRAAGRA